MDGDGDLDALSASRLDDTIAWYENQSVRPKPDFTGQQVLTTAADGATSVFA